MAQISLFSEYELILQKKSNLSASQRFAIQSKVLKARSSHTSIIINRFKSVMSFNDIAMSDDSFESETILHQAYIDSHERIAKEYVLYINNQLNNIYSRKITLVNASYDIETNMLQIKFDCSLIDNK